MKGKVSFLGPALLTVPEEITGYKQYFLSGNEYLSLPAIDPFTGGIESLNVIHMGSCGLLEFCGSEDKSLIQPSLKIDGEEQKLHGKMNWFYRHYWQPSFYSRGNGWKLSGKIIAPPGYRGGIYLLNLKNNSSAELNVQLGFNGTWKGMYRTVFKRNELNGKKFIYWEKWTASLVMGLSSPLPLTALAVSAPGSKWTYSLGKEESKVFYSSNSSFTLPPGGTRHFALYFGLNIDSDGASTTVVDLKRRGWENLEKEQVSWLKERCYRIDIPLLNSILNRNLFFNYFFALGTSLDTEELVPLTSRSPRYYVSAAFWSRDALLWSFPAVLLADQERGREMLLAVFQRHLKRAGEHAHYINGSLLYPGMELDQLCAYVWAVKQYVDFTGDLGIFKHEEICRGLGLLLKKLMSQKDPVSGLYFTFLDPCDDPPRYPFLIYNNALVWCVLQFFSRLSSWGVWEETFTYNETGENIDFESAARELREAIYKHGVVEGPFGPMFSWSVDGEGGYELYDTPPGSLQLLAYYGFCSRSDEMYRNTVGWIRSSYNPYNHHRATFKEVGCRHASNPWPMAAANDLLGENQGRINFLLRAGMDSGFACETIHPNEGTASTGLAFASAAGFIAYALWWRFARKAEG